MSTPRATSVGSWAVAGLVAGVAGLVVSHAASMVLTLRSTPVVAVGELVIELVPGPVADRAIALVGQLDKPLLVLGVLLATLGLLVYAGLLAARSWWLPLVVHVLLGGIGLLAVLTRADATPLDVLPVIAGVVTWMVVLSFLTDPLHAAEQAGAPHSRRAFLFRAAGVLVAGLAAGILGERFGRQRRDVDQTRRLLKLPVTDPSVPAGVRTGVEGMAPWQTPNRDFYLIHTALVSPTIAPQEWQLRIHGMVRREITLTYQELIDRQLTEDWITLNCVSNPVGGSLIGNAWWSGVRLAPILAEAGLSDDADAVLQTSHDGWTCGTPLAALTDDRNAMLAIAMNGQPLPIDHGFPVRMIVPGLYGYVSATKWVVDLEVTRFADIEAYWTGKGWAELGPVKIASRIEVPGDGETVAAGQVRVGGTAWLQHTGISGVEVALDGGAWQPAEIAEVPHVDTWVQWATTLDLAAGDHELRVRAIDREGRVQTGVERDVRPDGATGWHTVGFSAS